MLLSEWKLQTNVLDASLCKSHLIGAALRRMKFCFNCNRLCSPKPQAFNDKYSISFCTEFITASLSINCMNFGNCLTNTSGNQWFLQWIYFECKLKQWNWHWNPMTSPIYIFVPSNIMWITAIPLSSLTLPIK